MEKVVLNKESNLETGKSKKIIWIIVAATVVVVVVAVAIIVSGGFSPFSKSTGEIEKETESVVKEFSYDHFENIVSEEFSPFSKSTGKMEKATASVVKVFSYDHFGNEVAEGSGFIAFDDSTVVTNWHVIKDAYSCKISTDQDHTFIVADLLCRSRKKDVAILQLSEPTGLEPLQFGDAVQMKKGEVVTAIGSPLGLKNTVSQGILSGRVMEDSMDVLLFTAPISHGSSGGALLNEDGAVVGVTYAFYDAGQNLNLAIPSEIVEEVYQAAMEADSRATWEEIYMFEHLYTYAYDSMDAYTKSVVEASLEELKASPKKYDGKCVEIRGYISSKKYGTVFSDEDLGGYYVADEEYVSGDSSFDKHRYGVIMPIDNYSYDPVVYVSAFNIGGKSSLIDRDLATGEKVIVVGQVSYTYHKDNDGDFVHLFIDAKAITKLKEE